MTLYEELTELAGRATPGPWDHDEEVVGQINGWLEPDEFRGILHCSGTVDDWLNNSALIVKLRNALPDILAALEERDRLREATSFLCDRVAELDQSTGDFEDMVTDYYGHVVPALHNARAALEQPK